MLKICSVYNISLMSYHHITVVKKIENDFYLREKAKFTRFFGFFSLLSR